MQHDPPDIPLIHLLPNVLTIIAICAGLTAIRFGYQGSFETAVRLILLACILDGLDGRLARLLQCESSVGAELDSLADFLNFGVAPALILYSWGLADLPSAGWIAVVAFAICCVLRLARFNVSAKSEQTPDSDYFIGIPSPAAALLVMLPMLISFTFSDLPLVHPVIVAAYMILIGILMISQLRIYSFKGLRVSRSNAKYMLLGIVLLTAALLTYLWATMVVMCLAYLTSVIWAVLHHNTAKD